MFKNDIEIIGISSQEKINKLNYDFSFINYENNHIFINKKYHSIDKLVKVSISLEPYLENSIYIKDKTIILIEGNKIYNIEYRDQKHKRLNFSISLPLSISFQIPLSKFKLDTYNINLVDALYKPLSGRIIFENLTYLVTLNDKNSSFKKKISDKPIHKNQEDTKVSKEIMKITTKSENELLKNVDLFEEFL